MNAQSREVLHCNSHPQPVVRDRYFIEPLDVMLQQPSTHLLFMLLLLCSFPPLLGVFLVFYLDSNADIHLSL